MSRMLSASFDSRDETYLDTRIFFSNCRQGRGYETKVVALDSESEGRSTPVPKIVYRVIFSIGGYLPYLLR